jgi:hypothetical protein
MCFDVEAWSMELGAWSLELGAWSIEIRERGVNQNTKPFLFS